MSANTTTYFGDVLTVGNTTIQQNFSIQGAQSIYYGNVASTQNAIGWQSFFAGNVNVTTMNTLSVTANVGIGTSTAIGATLQILGNLFASNALQTPNVFASTSANIPQVLNTASMFATSGPGLVGVGTNTSLGANLHVQGNVFAANAMTAPVVNAVVANVLQVLNTAYVFATSGPGLVGVGTNTSLGANLHVQGNVWASNALSAPVVNAATSANILQTLITPSIFATSGPSRVGINTNASLGANLHVQGNVFAANAFQTGSLYSNGFNVATLNVTTLYQTSGPGVGIGTSTGIGAALQVQGNVFAANAIQTPNVFALTSANIQVLNTAYLFATTGSNVGVGTGTGLGANLQVQGNVFVANAISVGLTTVNVALNVATLNVTSLYRTTGVGVGIGTSTGIGASLQIQGNVTAANALSAPNVFASTSANVPILNTNSIFAQTGGTVGIGTSTGLGANLQVQGNVWVSNSMTGALQFTNATFDQAVYLRGTPRVFTPGGQLGIGVATNLGASLQIQGNAYGSNALSTPNVFALTSANTPALNTAFFTSGLAVNIASPGGWTLNVAGNLWASNTVNAAFGPVTTLNVDTVNAVTVANLQVTQTLYVSNSVSAAMNLVTLANTTSLVATAIFPANGTSVGIGSVPGGSNLMMAQGNLFAANAISGAFTNLVQANTSVLNVTSLMSTGGFYVGVGTSTNLGANLQVQGGVFVANTVAAPTAVIAVGANTPLLNTTFINSNIGIGTPYVAGGPTLTLAPGNLYAANAISGAFAGLVTANTTRLNVTSIVSTGGLSVGVGTATNLGANLQVEGNIFVANSISVSGNVYALTSMNAAVANTVALFGPAFRVGVGTTTGLGANLHVQGNIWASNITGTYLAIDNTTVNVTTLNTTTIWSLTDPATPIQSDITAQSNLIVGRTLQSATVSAISGVNYTLDLANVFVRNQLSTLRTQVCVYGNVVNGPRGQSDYMGGAYLSDGRVVFAPSNASNVGVFAPRSSLFSAVTPQGLPADPAKFSGAIAVPSGNVVFIPASLSNVGMYNPVSRLYSNVVIGASGFDGGVLAPTGNVIFVPGTNSNVGVFDPVALTFSNVPAASGYAGAVLTPLGNVVCVPNIASNVGLFNPVTRVFSNGSATSGGFRGGVLAAPSGNVIFVPSVTDSVGVLSADLGTLTVVPGASGFSGGVLLPTGNVLCVPLTASNIGLFDPSALTFSNATDCPGGFSGGNLLPDGRVVMTPWSSSNVGVAQTLAASTKEFCILPYFNHC